MGLEQFQLVYSFPFIVIKICGASAPFQTVLSIHIVLAFEAVSGIQMAKLLSPAIPRWRSVASTVLRSSMVTVSGPTPPGTGVI